MRTLYLWSVIVLLTLTSCTTPSVGSATPTSGLIGAPQFDEPQGLLPSAIDANSTAAPTMQPLAESEFQTVEIADLGVQLNIPEGWSLRQSDQMYIVEDADGNPIVQIGSAQGLPVVADDIQSELTTFLTTQGLARDEFEVSQSVIGIYNYVVVRGSGIDACQYAYLPIILSAVVLRFERATCDETGKVNETAFAIWRSMLYAPPAE